MTISQKKKDPVATILLVHADSGVCEKLQFMLSGGGFEIGVASDNDEAIARLRRTNPDLVIIDLGLAVAGASEFRTMLRDGSLGRRIPFIALSDGPPAQGARSALDIGAEECLSRPFSPPDILLRIRRTLERLEENRSLALSNQQLSGTVRRAQADQDEARKHLKERMVGVRAIIDFNRSVDPGLPGPDLRDRALRHISMLFETPGVGLFERAGLDSAWFTAAGRLGPAGERGGDLRIPASGEFMRILAASDRPLRIEEFDRIPGTAWEAGILTAAGFVMAVPVVVRRETRGFIALSEREGGGTLAPTDLDSLSLIASSLGLLLEVGRSRGEERRRALQTMAGLVDRIEAAHPFLIGHSRRVARLATDIGRSAGLPAGEIDDLRAAGYLHDTGYTPACIDLLSRPGPLSPAEWEQIHRHPLAGAQIARDFGWPEAVALAVRHHHEAWSGGGYPSGLKGEAIPRPARILALAEAYDAMSSARPWRSPLSTPEIERILSGEAGKRFDPGFAEILIAALRNGDPWVARGD